MTLPRGFRLVPDRATRAHDGGRILIGGSPRRALRLTDAGAELARRLLSGAPAGDTVEVALARRLLDAGLAHPVPPETPHAFDVVVPVYDDDAALQRCLAALSGAQVVVVDDGSPEAAAVGAIADAHDATVVRLEGNRGPAAARNAGAARSTADVIAFVDSDAVVTTDILCRLSAHFSDPHVVAVAPRVRASVRPNGALAAFAGAWSPLDLGPDPADVRPGRRVSYVPSTVLLVRRDALRAVGGFDETLRYGEDVDLVWRLTAAGGRVRYDPDVQVHHDEPVTWSSWLRRRSAYGTAAAPLALRHGTRAVPLRVRPVPATTVALVALRRPWLAGALAAATALRLRRRLRAASVPAADATAAALLAPTQAALGAMRWATQLWWPVLLLPAGRSRRRRLLTVAAVAGSPLLEWRKRRPALDPVRWTAAVWADEAAYGVGVWRGCVRERTLLPLVPVIERARTTTSPEGAGL